jgi:Tol biopolymer transport system component
VELEHIINKAMEKDRELRCQTAAELRADLKRLKRDLDSVRVGAVSSTATTASALRPPRPWARWVWPAVSAALALVLVGSIWFYAMRPADPSPTDPSATSTEPPPATLQAVPFNVLPGLKAGPSLSPDGRSIAFAWDGRQASSSHIYVQLIGVPGIEPVQLTTGPAEDVRPAWSPNSLDIAFLRIQSGKVSLCTVPAQPGPVQVLVEDLGLLPGLRHPWDLYWSLAWHPDSKLLAFPYKGTPGEPAKIYLISPKDHAKRKLTSGAGSYLGDGGPAFSPDGKWLAFLRTTSQGVQDLYLVNLMTGDEKPLTKEGRLILGCAWTPDSREIVFASNRIGNTSLWRLPITGGPPRPLVVVGGSNGYDPTISLRGSRLAYLHTTSNTNIWRVKLAGADHDHPATRLIATATRGNSAAAYSPDGQNIAFVSDRDGYMEIWKCTSEGANPEQLTSFRTTLTGTPRWSPDGQQIAFDSRVRGNAAIFLVRALGGPPQRLTTGSFDDRRPSWSKDGQWVYFQSPNRNPPGQIWKVPLPGGEAVQVTQNGGEVAYESDDGFLYYYRESPVPRVWKAPVGGGEEIPVLDLPSRFRWGWWTLTKQGIYFIDRNTLPRPTIKFFDLMTRRETPITEFEKEPPQWMSSLTVSPNGQWLLYTQIESDTEDIMLVENLR